MVSRERGPFFMALRPSHGQPSIKPRSLSQTRMKVMSDAFPGLTLPPAAE
jgi:hypothetical protein